MAQAPYTDRTPASAKARPGDHVTYESLCGRITERLGPDDPGGGARFDPQPGDRAYAGSDVGWEVAARVGDLLALTPVRAGPDVTCPVEVWANAGGGDALFPARYVRVAR